MRDEEIQRLNELVLIIKAKMRGFYHIGCALKEIRDQRLYREVCHTFDQYCREHLSISRAYAYRQIAAIEVIDNLSPNGDILVNEALVRPLTKLKAEQQHKAWQCALSMAEAAGRRIISRDVNKAVGHILEQNGSRPKRSHLEENDKISEEFKKAYDILFEAIMRAMNRNWETTSKEAVVLRLKSLIQFLKFQC